MIRASTPRERPPLLVCEHPQEVGPDGGVIVDDLRAVLLEVASEPPRLRQNQGFYQKEIERFQAALEPMDAWLLAALKWNNEGRLNQVVTWRAPFNWSGIIPRENNFGSSSLPRDERGFPALSQSNTQESTRS